MNLGQVGSVQNITLNNFHRQHNGALAQLLKIVVL